MRRISFRRVLIGAAGAGLVMSGLLAPSIAGASPNGHHRSSTVYVSPTGVATASDWSCNTAGFSSIQAADEAAPTGGTVVVCPGTYTQTVTVDKSLTLEGRGAVINATGQAYGIGVVASWVTIKGFTVENASVTTNGAPADGILTAGYLNGVPTTANHITVEHNVTENNVGSGIDVNSTSYSTAIDNYSSGNGVGINVADDLGVPASYNTIAHNISVNNPGGCGIVLAEHTGAGIFDNHVYDNVANDNGLGTPSAPDASAGSGIILAGEAASGGVYDNVVDGNTFDGNGHGGVTLHAHVPGLNFAGNVITRNRIGVNNVRTDYADTSTTGIYLGDASPLTITISGNFIHGDQIGIFTAGTITVNGFNRYFGVAEKTAGTPVYAG